MSAGRFEYVVRCSVLNTDLPGLIVFRDESTFPELFISHLLVRNARIEEDLGSTVQFERETPGQGAPAGPPLRGNAVAIYLVDQVGAASAI